MRRPEESKKNRNVKEGKEIHHQDKCRLKLLLAVIMMKPSKLEKP